MKEILTVAEMLTVSKMIEALRSDLDAKDYIYIIEKRF